MAYGPTNGQRINAGTAFPLRNSVRYLAGERGYAYAMAALFFVVPLGYIADTGSFGWLLALFLTIGTAAIVLVIATFYNRATIKVDSQYVHFELRRLFRRTMRDKEPLASYSALIAMTGKERGFPFTRDVHSIVLWHKDESVKQALLFQHHNGKRYAQRLADYEELFRLPVNPPSLELYDSESN